MLLGAKPSLAALPRLLQPQPEKNGGVTDGAFHAESRGAAQSGSWFVEPATGRRRRLPLENLRLDASPRPGTSGAKLVYSAARNSAVSESALR